MGSSARWVVAGGRALLRFVLLAGIAILVGLLSGPERASADVAPVSASADLSWTDPAHQSQVELLGGQIASHIAGRPVTVRCEGDADWAALVRQRGGHPNAESGYVASSWNGDTGDLLGFSSVIELSGTNVCTALQSFATAMTKPTKCLVPTGPFAPAAITRVRVLRTVLIAGRLRTRASWVLRRVASAVATQGEPHSAPCYLGGGKTASKMPASFWSDYESYAVAILTLAHESIHAGGVVGGVLSNGLPVGDPQAEAKAECYGMQWIPFVAESLGDTPNDGHAIAAYFWDVVYPRLRTSAYPMYWSADCRPLGLLDIHMPGAGAWP